MGAAGKREKCCDRLWGSRPLRHLPAVPDSLFLALAKTWVPALRPEAPTALRGARLSCCAGCTWCPRAGWQGPRPSAGCSPRCRKGPIAIWRHALHRGHSAETPGLFGPRGGRRVLPPGPHEPRQTAGRRETVPPQGRGRGHVMETGGRAGRAPGKVGVSTRPRGLRNRAGQGRA